MSDVKKKPVHVAIIPVTHIEKLKKEGRLPSYKYSVETQERAKLPVEEPSKTPRVQLPVFQAKLAQQGVDIRTKAMTRTRLRVMHDNAPSIPPDKQPPCESCVAPCCTVFTVELLKEEYDSGLYGEYAVKLEETHLKQLNSSNLLKLTVLTSGHISAPDNPYHYYMDAAAGETCKFLTNGKCSIYDRRPMACRVYTCVGDPRITDELRSGEVSTDDFFKHLAEKGKKNAE